MAKVPAIEVKLGKNKAVNPVVDSFMESVELREGLDKLDSLTVRIIFKQSADSLKTMKKYASVGEPFEVTLKGGSKDRKIYGDIIEASHSVVGSGDHVLVVQCL